MGQSQNPLASLSQQLNIGVSATATAPTLLSNPYTAASSIQSIAVDSVGGCYVAFGNTVAYVTPAGVVTTIGTSFSTPYLALDANGTYLYIANSTGTTVQRYLISTGTLSNFATGLVSPTQIFVDATSTHYIWFITNGGAFIKKYNPGGTIANNISSGGLTWTNFTVDSLGNLYAADSTFPEITRTASPSYGSNIQIGGGTIPYLVSGQMVTDSSNNLYFSGNPGVINQIPAAGGYASVTTFYSSSYNGLGVEAIDSSGNVYASTSASSSAVSVVKVTSAGVGSTFVSGVTYAGLFGINANGVGWTVGLGTSRGLYYYGPSPTVTSATFKFPSPPAGFTWTGTLACPNAPVAANFSATIANVSWGTWGGNSVYGPVQAFGDGGQQLVVTATGLTAGSTYEVFWIGSSDPSHVTAPIWPDVNSSALQAQIATISGNVNTITLPGSVTNSAGIDTIVAAFGFSALPATSPNFSMAQSYTGFQINYSGALTPNYLTIYNVTQGTYWQINRPSNIAPNIFYGTTGQVYFVPMQANAGDLIQIAASTGSGSGTGNIELWGMVRSAITAVTPSPNQTFDTVPYGGASVSLISAGATTNTQILAAPPTNYSYRLHSFSGPYNAIVATGGTLRDASGNVYGVIVPGVPYVNLGGQICKNLLYVQNLGVAQAFTLTYDTVLTPNVI